MFTQVIVAYKYPGCNFARIDHPSNKKRGGMCFYYKYLLPLKVVDVPSIMYWLEVKIGDKTCNFASLIRSPSQTKDEFENCIQNLEVHLEHISKKSLFLIVLVSNLMQECNSCTRTIQQLLRLVWWISLSQMIKE